MPQTYFDSDLTAEQIEAALEAVNGIASMSNNGKILYINNGRIAAKSASEWTGSAVLEPVTITENGTTTPPAGVDGFNSVTVNVQGGGGSAIIEPLSVTSNGTYTAPSGVDGYSPITVNVSGGGGSAIDVSEILAFSASSYYQLYTPENAYGLNSSSGWGSNGSGQQWWKVEFNAQKMLTEIILVSVFRPAPELNWGVNYILAEGSNDDTNWTTIKSFSSIPITDYRLLLDLENTAQYKYLKLSCSGGGNWAGFTNVQIYEST